MTENRQIEACARNGTSSTHRFGQSRTRSCASRVDHIGADCQHGATWQPYYSETLTDEDAIEMLLTVGNLYRVLAGADDDESEEETAQER